MVEGEIVGVIAAEKFFSHVYWDVILSRRRRIWFLKWRLYERRFFVARLLRMTPSMLK